MEVRVVMEKKEGVPMEEPHKFKAMRTLASRVGKPIIVRIGKETVSENMEELEMGRLAIEGKPREGLLPSPDG